MTTTERTTTPPAAAIDAAMSADAQKLPRLTIKQLSDRPNDVEILVDGMPLKGVQRVTIALDANDTLPRVVLELVAEAVEVDDISTTIVASLERIDSATTEHTRALRSTSTGEKLLDAVRPADAQQDAVTDTVGLALKYMALPPATRWQLQVDLGLVTREVVERALAQGKWDDEGCALTVLGVSIDANVVRLALERGNLPYLQARVDAAYARQDEVVGALADERES